MLMFNLAGTSSLAEATLSTGRTMRGDMRSAALVALVVSMPGIARAEEPSGCEAFKWSLKRESGLLQAADKPVLVSGGSAKPDGTAYAVKLVTLADAHLPQPPGRTPKPDAPNSGFLRFAALSTGGTVQVTLTDAVWVDVLQDGKSLKPSAFSGARDCPGVRKSLRFPLAASPFVIQISGTAATSIGLVAAPMP